MLRIVLIWAVVTVSLPASCASAAPGDWQRPAAVPAPAGNQPTVVNAAFNPLQMWDGRKPDNLSANMKPFELSAREKQDLVELLLALTSEPRPVALPALPQ